MQSYFVLNFNVLICFSVPSCININNSSSNNSFSSCRSSNLQVPKSREPSTMPSPARSARASTWNADATTRAATLRQRQVTKATFLILQRVDLLHLDCDDGRPTKNVLDCRRRRRSMLRRKRESRFRKRKCQKACQPRRRFRCRSSLSEDHLWRRNSFFRPSVRLSEERNCRQRKF